MAGATNPSGNLRIELIAGYNFVVRSNIESQPGTSPYSAYLAAKFCNDGATPLTNVYAYIGNFDGGNSTPGIYPLSNPADHPDLTGPIGGAFSLTHEGGLLGTSDASRYIGTIEPGECIAVYWLVSYPLVDVDGKATHSPSVKGYDDLSLVFDVWGTAFESGAPYTADTSRRVYMRNMLQAMANKIQPNTANKVPQEYLDLLTIYAPTWTNNPTDGSPGTAFTTEGYWYDLGNINQGFDNDGDLVPDYNAWLQPVGDPSKFDPSCFRLVGTKTLLVIKRSSGQPDYVVIAEDELYFTNLPPDNRGGIGLVVYEFMPLRGGCSSQLTPYQAVASGRDNEKFNGDYGASLGEGLISTPSSVTLDKNVHVALAGPGSNLNYTISFTNTGIVAVGQPDQGMPLVVQDAIPFGSTYVAASAATGNTLPTGVTEYTIFYSTNNGLAWATSEPTPASNVTHLQWWLSDPLQTGTFGVVTFQVTVNNPPPPLVHNVAGLSFGNTLPFVEDNAITLITGPNLISGTVFGDLGTGGGVAGNGIRDGAEPGITNITVTLYYDTNGNGLLDNADVMFSVTASVTNGFYSFTGLPNGNYIVVVDAKDPDMPPGYSSTSPTYIPVTLSGSNSTGNNFGFAPGLTLTKTGPTLLQKGGQAVYSIVVSNNLTAASQPVTYTTWASNRVADLSGAVANKQLSNEANVYQPNVPDGQYATTTYSNADELLGVNGYTLAPQAASITGVFIRVPITVSGTFRSGGAGDRMVLRIFTNNTTTASWSTSVVANTLPTGVSTQEFNVTSAVPWDWTLFNGTSVIVQIDTPKGTGGAGGGSLGFDQAGFRVQSSVPGNILTNVPLFDYYDTNVLQFSSAVPGVTSTDNGGPAPNTGRLLWSNVGPLNPAQSTNVTVTFNVIGPPGSAGTITTNTAVITNAYFNSGTRANQGFSQAVSEIPPTGSIGDTIFWDANRNGQQDASEQGVPGVLVELYSNATLVASQYTDSEGVYLFTNLPAGTYTVLVVQDDGDPDYPLLGAELIADPDSDGVPCWSPFAVGCDHQHVVTLLPGQDFLGADFGYDPPGASIGGLLWIDFNDNDQWNPGETGLAFIPVGLYSNGTLIATTLTDDDGRYLFYGLTDGTYSTQVITNDVDFPFPPGLSQTYDRDGFMDNIATNILVSGGSVVSVDSVPCTNCDLNNNFGYQYAGGNTLRGTVGLDDPLNIDGVLNGTNTSGVATNEIAFPSVTVYAYLWHDLNDDGIVDPGETIMVGVTTTDTNGDYLFTNLPDGFDANPYYIVSLAAPMANIVLTTTDASTPNPSFLVVDNQNLSGATLSAYQAVEINPAITNVDFAFVSTLDYDFGDLPDSYKTLLTAGARHAVKETPDLFLGADVSTEPNGQPAVAADADDFDDGVQVVGIWQNGVNGGTVQVAVGAGSGWLVGFLDFNQSGAFDKANELIISSAVNSAGGPDTNGVYTFTFNVPAGSLSTTNTTFLYSRFRLFPTQPLFPVLSHQGEASNGEVEDYRWAFNAISGTVYWDADTNTVFSGGDQPQAGVIIHLYDGDSNLVASTVTQLDGSYKFYGLPNGDYRIEMETPDGANAILDVDGALNGNDTIEVSLNNASVMNQNFLLDDQPLVGNISGTVWEDDGFGTPGNGVFDGSDMPVPGVLISLYRDINGDGTIDPNEFIASVVTDVNGFYAFNNLPDGNYIVFMTTPSGADSIDDVDGNPNGTDLIQATIVAGNNVEDQDFLIDGAVAIAELSGLAWFDASRNGIRENNETNRFAGVPVALLDASTNVVASTTTAADGTYSFTNVTPGTYTVRFDLTDLTNLVVATSYAGIDLTRDSDVTSSIGVFSYTDSFLLLASDNRENVDLGLMQPAPTRADLEDVWGEWVGHAEVVWQTVAEYGTAGFMLYRVDPVSGEEEPLSDIVSAAIGEEGAIYRVVEPMGTPGGSGFYRIEEYEVLGTIRNLGVHEVNFGDPRPVMATAFDMPMAMSMDMGAFSSDPSDCLKVEISHSGIYAVSITTIADGMGRDATEVRNGAETAGLAISTSDRPVAYHFDADGDRIVFYGQMERNWYASKTVYWIRLGAGSHVARREPGVASGGQNTAMVSTRFEQDVFTMAFRAEVADNWYYWDFVSNTNNLTSGKNFPFTLDGYAGGDATLRIQLYGFNSTAFSPDHYAMFEVNGYLVGSIEFDNQDGALAEVVVPEAYLNAGANILRVRAIRPAGQTALAHFVLDWFDATYTRALSPAAPTIVFEANAEGAVDVSGFADPIVMLISNSDEPVRIADENGNVSGGWLAAENGETFALIESAVIQELSVAPGACDAWFMSAQNKMDYVIITTRALESGAQALADYRESRGLRVGVAFYEDICDLFGYGRRNPESIRTFLRYAHDVWEAAPWMVVLAGHGHHDYLGVRTAEANPLPPIMVSSGIGVFASDGWFANIYPENGNPDLAIGRLPARNNAELLDMLQKIQTYESQHTDTWHKNLLLIAGPNDAQAGDFSASSEMFADAATGSNVQRLYMDSMTLSNARNTLFDFLNNAGAGYVHYTGHGQMTYLGVSFQNQVLNNTDINGLNNTRRPIVLALTCLAGRFDMPGQLSLAENLMRRNAGGAVAVWTASGLSYNQPATLLGEAFYETIFRDGSATLGLAIRRAQSAMPNDFVYGSTFAMYNLLGDPAMRLGGINASHRDDNTFAKWRWGRFAPDDLANEAISGAGGQPNESAPLNLVRYALGEPGGRTWGFSGDVPGENGVIHILLRRARNRSDVEYVIRATDNLIDGQWGETGAEAVEIVPDDETDTETVRMRIHDAQSDRLYFQLLLRQQ